MDDMGPLLCCVERILTQKFTGCYRSVQKHIFCDRPLTATEGNGAATLMPADPIPHFPTDFISTTELMHQRSPVGSEPLPNTRLSIAEDIVYGVVSSVGRIIP